MLTVVVADDHRLVREGLVKLLEQNGDLVVVGQAGDGREALKQTRTLRPDILLLDITMEEMDGFEVLAALDGRPAPRVVIVSMHEERNTIERALAAGAAAYVTKQAATGEVVAAIRAVGEGEPYLCERARASLAR